MKRVLELLLVSCLFVILLSSSPGRTMYTDLTHEGYLDEILEYIQDHNVLIEVENTTESGSVDAIKQEMETRERNWEELVGQEWGVSIWLTKPLFGDHNLDRSELWGAEAIVFTPFRSDLAVVAKIYSLLESIEERQDVSDVVARWREKRIEEGIAKWKRDLEKRGKQKHFYLKFIVRIPLQHRSSRFSLPSVLLRYEGQELKPVFSDTRTSMIDYARELRWEKEDLFRSRGERNEWKEAGLVAWPSPGLGNTLLLARFLYLDFMIAKRDFDPEGMIELYLSISSVRGEEGVFVADLSKMR